MTIIALDNFIGSVMNWATQNATRFQYFWPLKGGWEGWIQAEISAYILQQDNTIEILREQHIYENPRKSLDLLLNSLEASYNQILIEIKAESFENRDAFIVGVEDDLNKLENERRPEYKDSTCIMLAVAFDPYSANRLLAIQRQDKRIFTSIYVDKANEVIIAVALLRGDVYQ